MVDGVLTSCYAVSDHNLAHIAIAPIRWFPEMFQWIFGEDNNSPAIVNIAKGVDIWMPPNGLSK